MTKAEFITKVLPQFNEEGDIIVRVNGNVKFLKVGVVGLITISELTADGEYIEYYKPKKRKS